jgi:hypothetical protein
MLFVELAIIRWTVDEGRNETGDGALSRTLERGSMRWERGFAERRRRTVNSPGAEAGPVKFQLRSAGT